MSVKSCLVFSKHSASGVPVFLFLHLLILWTFVYIFPLLFPAAAIVLWHLLLCISERFSPLVSLVPYFQQPNPIQNVRTTISSSCLFAFVFPFYTLFVPSFVPAVSGLVFFFLSYLILIHHHNHHKHQGLDPLIRSVSRVTTVLANVSSVFQLFFFIVVCSDMISKGFGLVASFTSVIYYFSLLQR